MKLITSLLGLISWCLWGYTVIFVDPAVPLAPLAFYASLFVALSCTLSRLMGGGDSGGVSVPRSSGLPTLGHAAIVSTLLLFALWLQSLRMLTSFNGTLLAAMFLLIEIGFFASGGGRRSRARRRPRRVPLPGTGQPTEQ